LQKNILKSTHSFLFNTLLLFSVLLLLNSCDDKKSKPTLTSIENPLGVEETQENRSKNISVETQINSLTDTYKLSSHHTTYKAVFNNSQLSIVSISKPILLITLFKSSCKPCIIQNKSLTTVEKKYSQSLFVLNLLETPENMHFSKALHQSLGMDKNISQPLTVIYRYGQYYSHFEGLVPIEMLVHDIQEAIKR